MTPPARPPRTGEDALLALAGVACVGVLPLALGEHLLLKAIAWVRGTSYDASLSDTLTSLVTVPVHGSSPQDAFGIHAAGVPQDGAFYLLAVAPLVLGVAFLAGVGMTIWRHYRPKSTDSAVWATRRDLKPLVVDGPTPERAIVGIDEFGRLLAVEPHHSTLVVGATGSGKTSGFGIPRALEHEGPAFLLSVKNDLANEAYHRRAQLGKVWVYDPAGVTNIADRAAWTPLRQCTDWAGARRAAHSIVKATEPRVSTGDADFWQGLGTDLLAPLLYAAGLHDKTMDDVLDWLQYNNFDEPRVLLEQAADEQGGDVARQVKKALRQHHGNHAAAGNTVSGAYSTVKRALSAYGDPNIQDCSIADSIDPLEFLSGNNTLFVCAPTKEQEFLRPIFAAIVQDVLNTAFDVALKNGGALDRTLMVVLDEVAQIAPIPDLAGIAATARSHGISLTTLTQNYAQLVDRWGASVAETIWENHRAKYILPGGSSAKFLGDISRLLGDEAVEQESTTESRHGKSVSESTRYRPLAAVNELRSGLDGAGLLLYDKIPPAKVKLRPWYLDAHLKSLVGAPLDATPKGSAA